MTSYAIDAPPDTLISPALADTETSDAASAVRPIFLMFILITPLCLIVIINNKQAVFITFFVNLTKKN
jgi:hypothetical protein